MAGAVALTGTPGTGKTAVSARLSSQLRVIEVGELALALGAGRRVRGGVEVDVRRLGRLVGDRGALEGVDLVVGHLAHLLPVRDVVVLRCHPVELERRWERAGRAGAPDRRANFVVEATDAVLIEAVRPGRRVWEVDTTGRSVAAVAREVARRLRERGRSAFGAVDWLADRRVTAHLLDRPH
ncbi:MAG: AAA family ATPase [Thermoplasmata archaeon]